MHGTKKRKHKMLNKSGLFSNTGESESNKRVKLKHKVLPKKENGSALFPKVEEWTRLDWLRHRHKMASTKRRLAIDYGMSKLLTEQAVERPLIKAILKNQSKLPTHDTGYNYYLLNFACAAGSENSAMYILNKLEEKNKEELFDVLSGNTALCYAASSGNMSLCQTSMAEPYNCKIDFDVMRYAALSASMDFMHDLHKYFDNPKFRSPEITF